MKTLTKEQLETIRNVYMDIKGGDYNAEEVQRAYNLIHPDNTKMEEKMREIRKYYWQRYNIEMLKQSFK